MANTRTHVVTRPVEHDGTRYEEGEEIELEEKHAKRLVKIGAAKEPPVPAVRRGGKGGE